MDNTTLDEQIKNYLHGRLAPSDRTAFEKKLNDNPDAARHVAHLRVEMAAAELLIADDTRQMFQNWKKKPRRGLFGKGFLFWGIGFAAALFVLAVAVRQANRPEKAEKPLPNTTTPNRETEPASPPSAPRQPVAATPTAKPAAPRNYRLLAARSLSDPVLPNFRRVPTDAPAAANALTQAQAAYEAGNYERTLELLAQTDSTQRQSVAFLSAHALFRLGRYDEAADRFDRLVEPKSRQYRFAAEWGLLLCRLANLPKQEPEFRQQLARLLAQPEHPYREQALRLQTEMEGRKPGR